jgi:hypothetical protein
MTVPTAGLLLASTARLVVHLVRSESFVRLRGRSHARPDPAMQTDSPALCCHGLARHVVESCEEGVMRASICAHGLARMGWVT